MYYIQRVYVMPSTSGRAATYPRRVDKLKFFYELKDLRDRLHAERGLEPISEPCKTVGAPGTQE